MTNRRIKPRLITSPRMWLITKPLPSVVVYLPKLHHTQRRKHTAQKGHTFTSSKPQVSTCSEAYGRAPSTTCMPHKQRYSVSAHQKGGT